MLRRQLLHSRRSHLLRHYLVPGCPNLLHGKFWSKILFRTGRHLLREYIVCPQPIVLRKHYLLRRKHQLLHRYIGAEILFCSSRHLLRKHIVSSGISLLHWNHGQQILLCTGGHMLRKYILRPEPDLLRQRQQYNMLCCRREVQGRTLWLIRFVVNPRAASANSESSFGGATGTSSKARQARSPYAWSLAEENRGIYDRP